MNKNDLGNRMKSYENVSRDYLIKKVPVIIRIDGKAFHTFTKGFKKPFDKIMMESMWETAKFLCSNIQGCKIAYTQSDEISILITDYETITTDGWFEYNKQKIVSVSASMATLAFNNSFSRLLNKFDFEMMIKYDGKEPKEISNLIRKYRKKEDVALFDSRAFNLPKEEVNNYFIWRQQDCSKNSVQMVARSEFSHKQIQELNCSQLQEKLFQEKNINWNNFSISEKRGVCIIKQNYLKNGAERKRWIVDENIPIFTQDVNYIQKYV